MPNRILKESLMYSDQINRLTSFEECVWTRLILLADDYGRYYADSVILKSRLYPMRDDLTARAVGDAVKKLVTVGLIELYKADGKDYLFFPKWDKHQQIRSRRSKFPEPEIKRSQPNVIDSVCNHVKSDDINCNQMIGNDIKCPRNPNPNPNTNTESESNTKSDKLIDDADSREIQRGHDEALDAARDIGMQMNGYSMQAIVEMVGKYGKERVLYAISEAGKQGVAKVAYIEAVLKNEGKKKPAQSCGKTVYAQQYQQRDYDGVDESPDDLFERLIREQDG